MIETRYDIEYISIPQYKWKQQLMTSDTKSTILTRHKMKSNSISLSLLTRDDKNNEKKENTKPIRTTGLKSESIYSWKITKITVAYMKYVKLSQHNTIAYSCDHWRSCTTEIRSIACLWFTEGPARPTWRPHITCTTKSLRYPELIIKVFLISKGPKGNGPLSIRLNIGRLARTSSAIITMQCLL